VPYVAEIKRSALTFLRESPKDLKRTLGHAIWELQNDPRRSGAKALQGSSAGLYSYRVGDYRIVYTIEDARLVIVVVKVGDRKDIYR
jgi:mRNA interferase RelE/StbE